MAAKDVKVATDNLSCPVCYQLFKKPKFLPCHHSYCEQCLEKMQVQSKITCPECRKEAIVPPGGVKDLDNNFFINRLVDEFILKRNKVDEVEVECDKCCKEIQVVAFCPDCTLYLCSVCKENHIRDSQSCAHNLIALNELKSKEDVTIQSKQQAMTCKEHDEELLYYCETCSQLVCVYCAVKSHNGHNHDTVKKMADKRRQELKKISAPVEKISRSLTDTHKDIEEMRKHILQKGDEISEKIDEHYDRIIQKLVEQKEQLKQQVNDKVSQKEKAITTCIDEVKYLQAKVLSVKELNAAVENGPDQEVFSFKKEINDRIQKITNAYKQLDLSAAQQATMELVLSEKPLPQFGIICLVDPQNCEIIDMPKCFANGKKTTVTIITKLDSGENCSRGGAQVNILLDEVNVTGQVRDNDDGTYVASFVPLQGREVKLAVFVNGQQIKGSPYSIKVANDYVSIKRPSKVINNNKSMGGPWGIAFGKNGMWAAADWFNHCVYIFDRNDQLIRKFGTKGSGNGQFDAPAGVAFDSDDHLYVVDHHNHRVQKFTIEGNYLHQFGNKGSTHVEGKLKHPRGLTLHNQKVYVTDCDNQCISVFKTNGKIYDTIESAELGTPNDVAVNGDNQLLIADVYHHCILRFTLDGNYVGKFGRGQLNYPYGIAVDHCGFILVADTNNHRVAIFDKDGNYMSCLGSVGSAIGQFQRPYGIAVSGNGKIHVSDRDNRRIQVFF